MTGMASSSGYQGGESGGPSTSPTPAITFLIQEVRQGHSLAGGQAGLPGVQGAGRGTMLMPSWEAGGQSSATRVSSQHRGQEGGGEGGLPAGRDPATD